MSRGRLHLRGRQLRPRFRGREEALAVGASHHELGIRVVFDADAKLRYQAP